MMLRRGRIQGVNRAAALGICMCLGCANQPGDLRMAISPTRDAFAPGEPITLHVEFEAQRATACLPKERSWRYRATAIRTGGGQPDAFASGVFGLCGEEEASLLPLFPVLFVAAQMDVADAAGRYDLFTPGTPVRSEIELSLSEDRVYVWPRPRDAIGGPRGREVWEPGVYSVELRLVALDYGWLPAPFFWRAYPYELAARSEIEIVGTREAEME